MLFQEKEHSKFNRNENKVNADIDDKEQEQVDKKVF